MDMFPFVSGSYDSRSKKFDCQRTVNLYPEASGSGNSKSIAMLVGTPGTVTWGNYVGGTLGSPVRGMIRFNANIMIAIGKTKVWKFAADSTGFEIGTIASATTPVCMASNGTTIMVVTGSTDGYFIDPVLETITPIADPAFVGANRVDFVGGYFVCDKLHTQQYQAIGPYTTTIDPLAFASAEGAPDLLVGLIAVNNEVMLLGENSTEFHALSGNVDFPFEAIQGAFIGMGCAAANSIAKLTDANGQSIVCWLTQNEQGDGQVVSNVGYQPKRISDHALEFQIASYSRIDDAIAYTYQQEGHSFYMLSFPTADKTWCYDFSTELWHERTSIGFPDSTSISGPWTTHRHQSNCHVFFSGLNIVGKQNGNLYYFDLNRYSDDELTDPDATFIGYPIVAMRQCPHLSGDDVWMVFDEIWFDMQTGVGTASNKFYVDGSGGGFDPQLLLEWSDDGGDTFPNSRLIPLGKLGQRLTRVLARRLGKSKDRVFRVSISDPVRRCFIAAGTRTRVGA